MQLFPIQSVATLFCYLIITDLFE